jgi:hypothetical protein
LRRVVNSLDLPELDLYNKSFSASHGTLEGSEAASFHSEVMDFCGRLKQSYQKKARSIIAMVEAVPKKEQFSKLMFTDMDKQLAQFETDIANKELTLSRLDECLAKLKKT